MLKITNSNFDQIVKENETVVIDFYADWCGPCRALGPIVEKVADEFKNVQFGKVNVDDEPELANKFGVTSIPFVVKVVNGKAVDSFLGLRDEDSVREFFK